MSHLEDPFWRWRVALAPTEASGAGDDPSGGDEAEVESPAPDAAEADASASDAQEAGEGEEVKAPAKKPWYTDRIAKITARNYELQAERDAIAQELERTRRQAHLRAQQEVQEGADQQRAAGRPGPTREQFDNMVAQRAYAIAEAERFNDRCNQIYDEGTKAQGFNEALNVLQSNFGQFDPSTGMLSLPYGFLQMVIETDDPIQVIQRLGKNPELAERIFNTPNPISQATQLAKLAIGGKGKVSSAPPPVKGKVGGNAGSSAKSLDDPDMPLDEWMRQREKQVADRRR